MFLGVEYGKYSRREGNDDPPFLRSRSRPSDYISFLQQGGFQRPRLQSRQFDDLRRVEAFGKDHPAPQSGRIFGDVTISRELALPQCDVTPVVICVLPAFDHRAERRQIILWRDAAGAAPDFIGHPPVGAVALRYLADVVVKSPPCRRRQFAVARGWLELMNRAINRVQFYRPFFSVEKREISFGQQRETVGRRKREAAHPQKRDLILNRLRNS